MQVAFPRRNQFFADPDGKRQICHSVPVQVANFATADMKKDHPATMRFGPTGRSGLATEDCGLLADGLGPAQPAARMASRRTMHAIRAQSDTIYLAATRARRVGRSARRSG